MKILEACLFAAVVFILLAAMMPTAFSQPAGSLTVVGGPSITAAFIDRILAGHGSPAAGTGQSMHSYGIQYGIDPVFALAFFLHESTFGTKGVARSTRSLGNLRCFCKAVWQYFPSWPEGYEAWYKLIAGPLYVKAGLVTVKQIIPKYAPAEDNNNEAAYISAVETAVTNWRAAA